MQNTITNLAITSMVQRTVQKSLHNRLASSFVRIQRTLVAFGPWNSPSPLSNPNTFHDRLGANLHSAQYCNRDTVHSRRNMHTRRYTRGIIAAEGN